MDSGNSGSLQSSSGGDEEFDSRGGGGGGGGGGVDSSPLSALLRQSPSPSSAAFSLHGSYFGLQDFTSAPPPQHQQQQQAGAWSGSFAGGASGLPSSSSPRVGHADAGTGAPRPQGADTASAAVAAQGQGAGAPAPRGSRKRTRASRRAPTTVLTTDTSNFRAMVQEFTGIPSPPFGAGVGGVGLGGPAASLRTRFDHIFPPPSSSLRSGAGVSDAAAASLPPYLLRPFPHKLPSSFPPFTSPSSSSSPTAPSSSSIGSTNASAATGAATNTAAAAPSNPAAPTAAGNTFQQQQLTSSALLRLQQDASSYLSFQNLLDSSQSIFGGAAGGFAQAPPSRLHDPAPSPSDFLAGVGSGSLGGGFLGSEGPLHLHHSRSDAPGHGHGGDELSGVVAAGASGGGSCKLNYSSHAGAAATTSSAAAGADKPPDGGGGGAPGRPGRSDGLDPWICTSE
ncbi:unnamed protein product [Urochloa decumbens]|uniref:VQ domain-containing protein n=1 Tax=Urochloa decumbens TaxID=240449 RepID=A0ABC9G8H3_9POAL